MSFAGASTRLQAAVFDRLGEDGFWNEASTPVRVRFASSDELASFGSGGRLIVGAMAIRVRRSELPSPSVDDTVRLPVSVSRSEAMTLKVYSDPTVDRNGVWSCPVVVVDPVP